MPKVTQPFVLWQDENPSLFLLGRCHTPSSGRDRTWPLHSDQSGKSSLELPWKPYCSALCYVRISWPQTDAVCLQMPVAFVEGNRRRHCLQVRVSVFSSGCHCPFISPTEHAQPYACDQSVLQTAVASCLQLSHSNTIVGQRLVKCPHFPGLFNSLMVL